MPRTRGSIRQLLLGGELSEGDLEVLLHTCRAVHAGSRTPLLRAEEDRVLLLVRGAAKAHIVTSDGDEVITQIVGPGFAAGLLATLGHADTGTDLTSLTPIDGLSITGAALRYLVRNHPSITTSCLRTIAGQHASSSKDRARFAGTCISQRVAHRLIELARGWGRPDEDGAVRIGLSLSQEELAAWSGASRESVAKVLHTLRESGVIRTGRRTLTVLDLDRLQERCERPAIGDLQELLQTIG